MRISRIKIENYRSIKQIEMELSGIVSLVGPNNAGKTNILSALNFLLGDRWPTKNGLELTDWFAKDDHRDIRIQAWFAPNERNVKSVWFYFPAHGNAETRMEFSNGSTYNLSSEIREECALVYLDATHSFERHFGTSQWSIFGKVIRQLGEDFKQSSPASNSSSNFGLKRTSDVGWVRRARHHRCRHHPAFRVPSPTRPTPTGSAVALVGDGVRQLLRSTGILW